MQELVKTVARKEVTIIERKVVEKPIGGAGAYQKGGTLDEFLENLEIQIKLLQSKRITVGNIEIITDGKDFAAQMQIGNR